MITELYDKLGQDAQKRQTLIAIQEQLRGENKAKARSALISHCGGDFTALVDCLSEEDAQARKNAALVMGELGVQKLLAPLWKA